MLGNPKNAIWEAFLLTVVVFIFGIILGAAFESSKLNEMNNYYVKSEILMTDLSITNTLSDLGRTDCKTLIDSHMKFADRIYEEAKLLEKLESSEKVTEVLKTTHRKYDLLRTSLWIDTMKTMKKCDENFSTVVYLYEYNPKDLVQKAKQNVWSNILYDLKQKKGSNILLIPIAVDNELISLDSLIKEYGIKKYPAVIINNEIVITELKTVEDVESILQKKSNVLQ